MENSELVNNILRKYKYLFIPSTYYGIKLIASGTPWLEHSTWISEASSLVITPPIGLLCVSNTTIYVRIRTTCTSKFVCEWFCWWVVRLLGNVRTLEFQKLHTPTNSGNSFHACLFCLCLLIAVLCTSSVRLQNRLFVLMSSLLQTVEWQITFVRWNGVSFKDSPASLKLFPYW